jgi:sec-independent protein translocase protein TatA
MTQGLMIGMLGPGEIAPIAIVLLLLFGVKKMPEIARGLGEGMREFKKAVKDIHGDEPAVTPEPVVKGL